ncbi:hypothetical protein AA0313_2885 [Acetobacter indonesiensis NRIC 0313]|uniref:Uncharacterized protein n=2 Tax=Acetobacteraceae TaxID=433 RepID=A0A6N3T9P1_9PROT|nr:hypothetical protein [Acetobacter indonesiensis]GAN64706.1 hypothetical protein Abin_127_002 [Acetobacter indonesiensis]GBQ62083.1 hypothetical protein AA0313_2885 [Acetobacter indonesiensis NRIC 0313]GEN04878.1 hypothetical protein AIN02nite_29030 [Acetobacter indonesiensis]
MPLYKTKITQMKYYVFEKGGFLIACPYYDVLGQQFDNLSAFDYLINQGFCFYDIDFSPFRQPIFANNPNEAVEEAQRNREREINQLKTQISLLQSEREFSFKETDAYKVFGQEIGVSKDIIKEIHTRMLRYFRDSFNDSEALKGVKSEYMEKIINSAWNVIKKSSQ